MKFCLYIVFLLTINSGIAHGVKTASRPIDGDGYYHARADDKSPIVPYKTTGYINRRLKTNAEPLNTNVPIKDGLIYLLFAGTGLAFYMFYKYEKKVTPTDNN